MTEENTNAAAENEAEAAQATTETVAQDPKEFLENFNWDKYEQGIERVEESKLEEFETLVSANFVDTADEEVVVGKVVYLTEREAIIDINAKSEGVISLNEFRYNPDLKVGDEVEVLIDIREDKTGQLVLSHRKARTIKAWDRVNNAHDKEEVVNGFVKCRTKGGMIVDVFGIEAFLPGSQIDVKPIRDFDIFVGKNMEVKVVKINHTNDNVVVSHKVLIEKDLEAQRQTILTNLDKGQVLEGVIKNMTNFGVFIDLGGVDGLLHITDISWGRINHPQEVLKLDQKIQVVVLDFDENKKRISLGMKQLQAHPWEALVAETEVGSKVKGKIVNVADYGAFLEVLPGVEGLIHVSEMSWSQHLRNPQDFLKVGDEMEAVVLTLDRTERKMSLGVKQLTEDPWNKTDLLAKYAIGTKHKGTVRNLTNFGLFLELEEGIDGLVHVSDLSWTKKIKHPSEFVKVGDALDVVVIELDAENRRLALGHKQLEENPWDTFESVFTLGSIQKATIISKTDKMAVLELPYGIEGLAPLKQLVKADESVAEVGEALDFAVIEFQKEDRKIILSHTRTFTEATAEEVAAATAKPEKKKTTKAAAEKPAASTAEKSTMGDIGALSALKEQMEGAEREQAIKKLEKKSKKAE